MDMTREHISVIFDPRETASLTHYCIYSMYAAVSNEIHVLF